MVVGTGSDLSIDLALKVKRTSLLFISHCTLSFSLSLFSFSPLSSSSCYGCARNNMQHSILFDGNIQKFGNKQS